MCLWREKLGGRVIIEQVTMGPCKHVKWGTYSYNIQTFQWENYTYQKADRLSFAITPILLCFTVIVVASRRQQFQVYTIFLNVGV